MMPPIEEQGADKWLAGCEPDPSAIRLRWQQRRVTFRKLYRGDVNRHKGVMEKTKKIENGEKQKKRVLFKEADLEEVYLVERKRTEDMPARYWFPVKGTRAEQKLGYEEEAEYTPLPKMFCSESTDIYAADIACPAPLGAGQAPAGHSRLFRFLTSLGGCPRLSCLKKRKD
jgi:hypothetical protein